MRIAVLVGAFPTVSETFILNQVTGLLDRGHDVRIFAGKVGNPEVIHSDIVTYGLMDRVRYSVELPDEYPRRFMAALPALGLSQTGGERAVLYRGDAGEDGSTARPSLRRGPLSGAGYVRRPALSLRSHRRAGGATA